MSIAEEPRADGKWVGQALRRKEDPRLITGRGPLRRRHGRPRHALHGRRPLARGAREDRLDRRLGRRGAARRPRRLHRRGPRHRRPACRWPGCRRASRSRRPSTGRSPRARSSTSARRVAVVLGDDKYAVVDAAEQVRRRVRPAAGRRSTPRRRSRTAPPLVHPDLGTNKTHEWTHRRRRHGRGVGRGRRRHRAADRQPPHRRRADRAARAASPTTAAASSRCTSTSQIPHLIRLFMAGELGMGEDRIRVIAPDVGGGFGVKITHYPRGDPRGVGVAQARPPGQVDRDAHAST